jgi:GNAT superfamily N-acetyltransferase
MTDYEIRPMTRAELDIAVDWAASEGWNPGLYDADSFYTADPEGFLVGLIDGQPISSISVVRFGDHYAFLGFYIVKPEFRGQGYGYRLWQNAMARMDGRDVGLDGVVAQVGNYEKSGFESAYLNSRFSGPANPGGEDDPRIVPLSDIPFEDVLAFDSNLVAAPRAAFLQRWIQQPESHALGLREDGQLAGYGMIRRCREGYKIGPLFANSRDVAEALFSALERRVPAGSMLYIDVPAESQSPQANALVRERGMTPAFSTARMYRMWNRGMKISLPLHRWYGVTSLELG